MIKYSLICAASHEFQAWFSSSTDFDMQSKQGLLLCPVCGSHDVEKAIMAPNVSTSRRKAAIADKQAEAVKAFTAVADKIRQDIETNCDDVGDKFADEARAIHYGEKPERGIYGQATAKEASDLRDEGVAVAPLPESIAPKPKDKLH